MAAELLPGDVTIHASLVGQEVLINSERDFNGAVGLDLRLELGLTAQAVGGLKFVHIHGVLLRVLRVALTFTSGRRCNVAAGTILAGRVMIAIFKEVRLTPFITVVFVTRAQARLLEEGPGNLRPAALATVAAGGAACNKIRCRDACLIRLSRVDADTIAHGLHGTESPARAAVGLVTDFLDGLAIRPLGARIESVIRFLQEGGIERWEAFWCRAILDDAHESLDGLGAHVVPVLVVAGLPRGVGLIHLLRHGVQVVAVEHGGFVVLRRLGHVHMD